jgi:hypothetical protein
MALGPFSPLSGGATKHSWSVDSLERIAHQLVRPTWTPAAISTGLTIGGIGAGMLLAGVAVGSGLGQPPSGTD